MSSLLSGVVDRATAEMQRRQEAAKYKEDPALWTEHMLGMKLWSKQCEIGNSVVENKSTAVKAGHGVGKSFLVAVLACWWIDTRSNEKPFVASTAPSQQQIGAIVWKEIRDIKSVMDARYKAHIIDHTLPGYITSENEWKLDGGTILGFGRKPPDNKVGDFFQGIHGSVLAIGDEACGLSMDMIDALGNITSNENSRRILIANPTNPTSHFAKIFKDNNGAWALHTISVLDSPNFTGEEMPEAALANLTGKTYVEDKKLEYGGEDNPRYIARVLGEFAFDTENTLITQSDMEIAKALDIEPGDTRPYLGVDVARFGTDRTVVYMYQDGQLRHLASWGQKPTTETSVRVDKLAREVGADQVRVDATGVGGGVKDQLSLLCDGLYAVVELNGGAGSPDRRRWLNARAFWYDTVRTKIRTGQLDIDTADEPLQDELLSIQFKYSETQGGGLQIESKEDMKKRGMRSPDLADAAVYACCDLGLNPNDPLAAMRKGDRISMDTDDFIGDMPKYLEILSRF